MEEAIFAGGCFWGVEYYMLKEQGVLSVESGYIGGEKPFPTYLEVKTGQTGHAEAVRILYDATLTNYEKLLVCFMEIHDPTQLNGQGYDLGTQYRSEIFYKDDSQRQIAQKVVALLVEKGYEVVTKISPATTFYVAEDYHQNYYNHKGTLPDCHAKVKRF